MQQEMTIQSIAFAHTTKQLIRSISVGGQLQTERNITYFAFQDQEGKIGMGELSPLSGLHQESPKEALEQLRQVALQLREQPSFRDEQEMFRWYALQKTALSPSVRFCLGMAIGVYWSQKRPQKPKPQAIPVQALLWGSPQEQLNKAALCIQEGYQTFKVKVGRATIEEDIFFLKELRNLLPSGCQLRLDANQSWSLKEALTFGRKAKPLLIDYIEEPLSDPNQLTEYCRSSNALPFAYDETLTKQASPMQFQQTALPKAIVLKSQMVGDLHDHQQWARWARKRRVKVILSSCFESEAGLAWQAILATRIPIQETSAMGFGTLDWFETHIPLVQRGIIRLHRAYETLHQHTQQIDWKWEH